MNVDKEEDIEPEDTNIDEEYKGPFNPQDIDVDIATVNLGLLLDQLENNEIELRPEFQRESDLWTKVQKSRLIESVLLGLPLPSFYFSQDPQSNHLIVVDGLQRLCAFNDFCITKTLKLEGLQFLPSLENKCYTDLERPLIRRINSLKITLNTLRKNTPTKVKFVIFQRVNTAGLPLKPQEMRNALYPQNANQLLRDMAALSSFKNATGGHLPSKRMTDCDFANRFLTFYLYKEEYNGNLDEFMGNTLEKVGKMSEEQIHTLLDTFDHSMQVCYQLLGDKAFRRPNPKKPNTFLAINKAIFDALSVSVAHLSSEEQEKLILKRPTFQKKYYALFTQDEFSKSISYGATKTQPVKTRHDLIQQVIQTVLSNDN